jgi:hypothetical protein
MPALLLAGLLDLPFHAAEKQEEPRARGCPALTEIPEPIEPHLDLQEDQRVATYPRGHDRHQPLPGSLSGINPLLVEEHDEQINDKWRDRGTFLGKATIGKGLHTKCNETVINRFSIYIQPYTHLRNWETIHGKR